MTLDDKLRLGGRLGNKLCKMCGEYKPFSEFYKNRSIRNGGLQYYCKKCQKEQKKR